MKFTLLTILEIQHISKGKVVWSEKNLPNTFHSSGEDYMLRAAFLGGQTNTYIPTNYYFGLDARDTISTEDTMTTASVSEASGGGYLRQAVASSNQFIMSLSSITGHYVATSPILTFTSTSGWGPVKNLFLTDKSDNTGYLIASVSLNTTLTVEAGDGVHMRMGLSLGYCPALPDV